MSTGGPDRALGMAETKSAGRRATSCRKEIEESDKQRQRQWQRQRLKLSPQSFRHTRLVLGLGLRQARAAATLAPVPTSGPKAVQPNRPQPACCLSVHDGYQERERRQTSFFGLYVQFFTVQSLLSVLRVVLKITLFPVRACHRFPFGPRLDQGRGAAF